MTKEENGPGGISGKTDYFPRTLGSDGERHSHKAERRRVLSVDKKKSQEEFQGGRRGFPIFGHLQGGP